MYLPMYIRMLQICFPMFFSWMQSRIRNQDPPLSEKNIIRFNVVMNVFIYQTIIARAFTVFGLELATWTMTTPWISAVAYYFQVPTSPAFVLYIDATEEIYSLYPCRSTISIVYINLQCNGTNLTTRWQDSNPEV